jgi:hypothetical protein
MAVTQIEQEDAALLSFDQVLAKMPDALRAKLGRAGNPGRSTPLPFNLPNAESAPAQRIVYAGNPSGIFSSAPIRSRRPFRYRAEERLLGGYPQAWDRLNAQRAGRGA